MTLDEVADELYGLDPAQFVAARKAHAERARRAGDRSLAAAIADLRKPTLVGWAVNLLSRHAPDSLDELTELADDLRSAQHSLDKRTLRDLTRARGQVVGAVTARARALAAERGHPLSANAEREVNQTLHAALADPHVADLVRRGAVVAAADYSGFGLTDLAPVEAPEPEPEPTPPEPTKRPPRRRDDDATEAERLRAALDHARHAADDARREVERAEARLAEADDHIGALRAQLDHAEQQRRFAAEACRTARERAEHCDRDLAEAERRLAQHR
jgi:hypothetical protein